jgi:hypothetical protein
MGLAHAIPGLARTMFRQARDPAGWPMYIGLENNPVILNQEKQNYKRRMPGRSGTVPTPPVAMAR